ncbi:MAG TPA: gamma-glutamyl-gamma-aminobutyrate hydrolase family protein [Stellaceae bacterium]|nr:gamma-glutamyl-gamma-aminobutyrate hydrolase family protein [Stellaceae bacterium]
MPAPFGGREPLPVIGIVCCVRTEGEHTFHTVGEKYIVTVTDAVGGLPLLIPAAGDRVGAEESVQRLDGLLFTGSRTDIEPHHYGGTDLLPERKIDPKRDQTSLPLLRAAARLDLPVLAICRGMQELNVALGGSLHTVLHEVPGRLDHRAPKRDTMDERYAHLAHPVELAPGGFFAALNGGAATLDVNSLHFQGIDRLAAGLVVEATAPDGQIEGVYLPQARFIVGVQWHPEYRHQETPFSRALFAAFGDACRAHARRRRAA